MSRPAYSDGAFVVRGFFVASSPFGIEMRQRQPIAQSGHAVLWALLADINHSAMNRSDSRVLPHQASVFVIKNMAVNHERVHFTRGLREGQ